MNLKSEGTSNFSVTGILFVLFISLNLFSINLFSQQQKKLVEYTPEFKFKEGVFVTFDQVLINKPILKTRIISKIDISDFEYFPKLFAAETIQYFDDYGIQQTIKVSEVWGYCRKGMLFINWQGEFNRIPVVGSISYFAAVVVFSRTRSPDAFDTFSSTATTPDSQQEEMRQFLIDFETGAVLDYNFDNVVELLKKDNSLYEEYKALKKRKKKNMTFVYIRKFNTNHPIYFPVD